jgi:hypothetical protein
MGKIISNIIATMSDQAATNHVFNEKNSEILGGFSTYCL